MVRQAIAACAALTLMLALSGCGNAQAGAPGPGQSAGTAQESAQSERAVTAVTKDTTVREVIENPALSGFGHLLFPVDRDVPDGMTLAEVSSSSVYVWYSHIQADKTVVMIAHTLPIVKSADQILVVDGGRVAEAGTHDQLLAKGGKYAAMWEASRLLK